MSKETELVEVTIKVPKGILQFLEDIKKATWFSTADEYLESAIVSRVMADIDSDVFNPTLKAVAEKYDFKKEFEVKD